ncbi:MAG: 50S ribosomal protein L9 [Gemmatimonadales bacterium]|nr:MAG: 50S ribosomal protein L9 [Gemmatimonadales bacterium]
MKLILKETVENLGQPGDVVTVKPGYARNFLLPQGLAYEASAGNLRRIEEEKRQAEERSKRDTLEARRRASQIDEVSIAFEALASEEGRLFGSIAAQDVAERLNELELDFEVERRQVVLDEPLKEVGVYQVAIRLHSEVEVEVEVRITREEG